MKHENKARLAAIIQAENGITVDLDSIFDVQVKRIHEYKRQLLNVLHIVASEYLRIKADRSYDAPPAQLPLRRQGGARLRAWPSGSSSSSTRWPRW